MRSRENSNRDDSRDAQQKLTVALTPEDGLRCPESSARGMVPSAPRKTGHAFDHRTYRPALVIEANAQCSLSVA